MKNFNVLLRFASLIICLIIISTISLAQTYSLIDLGTLGGSSSGASDITEDYTIVGGAATPNSGYHAYIWILGFMVDLGIPDGYNSSGATAVNNLGRIAGYANGEYQSQYAYMFDANLDEWEYLGTLPGLDYSVAVDINNFDQVAGYSFMLGPGGGSMAWLWENGQLSSLGTLGGDDSHANAINEGGEIVGYSQIYDPDDYITHACLWISDAIIDLGVLDGEVTSAANDINDIGDVVGSSSHQIETYPFTRYSKPCLWQDGEIYEIPLLPGYSHGFATAINNNGLIAGSIRTHPSSGPSSAFIYSEGEMFKLEDLVPSAPEWEFWSVSAITDDGRLIGSGLNEYGQIRGFLLIPEQTDVPEAEASIPSSFLTAENYPNPFNNTTTINYTISSKAFVSIDIYNILGEVVDNIVSSYHDIGRYQVNWNSNNHSSGMYFYKVQAGNETQVGTMTLIK